MVHRLTIYQNHHQWFTDHHGFLPTPNNQFLFELTNIKKRKKEKNKEIKGFREDEERRIAEEEK